MGVGGHGGLEEEVVLVAMEAEHVRPREKLHVHIPPHAVPYLRAPARTVTHTNSNNDSVAERGVCIPDRVAPDL